MSPSIWIIGSGASHHMSYDGKLFVSLNPFSSISELSHIDPFGLDDNIYSDCNFENGRSDIIANPDINIPLVSTATQQPFTTIDPHYPPPYYPSHDHTIDNPDINIPLVSTATQQPFTIVDPYYPPPCYPSHDHTIANPDISIRLVSTTIQQPFTTVDPHYPPPCYPSHDPNYDIGTLCSTQDKNLGVSKPLSW
ncbi:hypothetical protein KIW84_063427 [Lathyrus oleraceus]|uniref:Uncharacterized protein n=1 Tax=Pisum sativum TaxID=3888 RepID=A0A9D4WBJ4_PEA|nr:hypothetical protein KIW84_063427 [Pisum sativum]